jgi:drug/metabolite transporter (DMT)-like permease
VDNTVDSACSIRLWQITINAMTATTAPVNLPANPARWLVPALLACYLVWGSTYLAIRFALVSFPPYFQMGTRFVVAGALLLVWMRWRGVASPTPREWRHASVIGTLMLAAAMGWLATAQQHIGSGLVATFIATVPMVVCAFGLAAGKRPTPLELAGMALGAVGVLMLVRGASFTASPMGIALMVGSVVAWSLGSVLQSTRLPLAPGPMGFASEMLCGGVVLTMISFALGEQAVWPPQPLALAAWVYLVVFGSLIAFSAYLYLLANTSPAMATSYAFVNPVIALGLGVALGGEVVSGGEWVACAVILAGVVLIFLGKASCKV